MAGRGRLASAFLIEFPLWFDNELDLSGNFQSRMDAHAVVKDVAPLSCNCTSSKAFIDSSILPFINPWIGEASSVPFSFLARTSRVYCGVVDGNMDASFIDPVEQQTTAIVCSEPD